MGISNKKRQGGDVPPRCHPACRLPSRSLSSLPIVALVTTLSVIASTVVVVVVAVAALLEVEVVDVVVVVDAVLNGLPFWVCLGDPACHVIDMGT